MSACSHKSIEPVVTLDGETVAALCVSCLDEVPLSWFWMQEYDSKRRTAERLRRMASALALKPDCA